MLRQCHLRVSDLIDGHFVAHLRLRHNYIDPFQRILRLNLEIYGHRQKIYGHQRKIHGLSMAYTNPILKSRD